jgi:hypothetical protein
MEFQRNSWNSMLSGSHVSFRKMEREYSESEKELDLENKRKLQEMIGHLRRLRTEALSIEDEAGQQEMLRGAHEMCSKTADTIIDLASKESPVSIDEDFLNELVNLKEGLENIDADSGYSLPPQFSIGNLFKATEDILMRVQEAAGSYNEPNHRLTKDELKSVLTEFFRGTNDLTVNAIEEVLSEGAKVGGILSGGAIYAEIVKKMIEKYGDGSVSIDTFVIAVDKKEKKIVCERSEGDEEVRNVVLTDDVINEGGTMITALWQTGRYFPNAKINSGKGSDSPGGWKKRRDEEFMVQLERWFQDFAEYTEEGKKEEALKLYEQAEAYAKENGVELQRGWILRKRRMLDKS